MNTFEQDAASKLDKIAWDISKSEGVKDYSRALSLAIKRNPGLAHQYAYGTMREKRYELSPIEKTMAELQADPGLVRRLAGEVMDHFAQKLAGKTVQGSGGQVSPESYAAALKQISSDHPNLSRAANSGFISSDDFELLATLVPAIGGECEKIHGARPITYQNTHAEVRKFADAGREYRICTFAVK